jgi:hypothetical protein
VCSSCAFLDFRLLVFLELLFSGNIFSCLFDVPLFFHV